MMKTKVKNPFANLPTIHGYLPLASDSALEYKKHKLYVSTQQSVKRNCESESDACRLCTPKYVPKNLLHKFFKAVMAILQIVGIIFK